MRVLVTGGMGFIGRYVVDRLLKDRDQVTVLDSRREREALPEGVTIALGDTRDPVAVFEAVGRTEGVIHLAGVLGTQETIQEPQPAVETNIVGGLNIFRACRHAKVPCAYITVGNYWMNNSYSITKTTAERFAWMFNQEHDTKIAVVRALNAYGPRQKASPVRKIMPNFILPVLQDEPITVYGDGAQIMDMIHVRDVADVMVRALKGDHGQYKFSPEQNGDNYQKFEAGTGRPTTVQEIAEMVIRIAGKGTITHVPMRPGEPEGSVVLGNPETLRSLYDGQVPELIRLEDGIAETIEYYKQQLN
jgi:UDP-glucose 4-epimerase